MPGGSTGGGTRNRSGRWTRQEHERFLGGLEVVGERWCLVATYVPTRTERQIRTHAQKYMRKIRQGLPFPEEPYESSVESDNDDGDDAGAAVSGGAAAASNGEPGPHAHFPSDSSRHGVPMAAPFSDGREFSRNSDTSNAVWNAGGGSGGHGGSAAPFFAPVATAPPVVNPNAPSPADNFHGVWLQGGPQHGGPGFRGQEQQQFLAFEGHGADMAGGRFSGGRFSPPGGEIAPFRNWPVADGDRHANLLVDYGIGDMDGPNNYRHNDSDNDRGDGGEAAAAAPRFR